MVTVGISSYNQWDFLKLAITSALSETPSVYVYDDASTDDTIARLVREFPGVRASWNKRNHGNLSRAWTWFIRHCEGDWLLLLSGDDEVFPGAIERIEHYAEGADWLFGDLEFIDAAGNPTGLQTHEWMPTDPKAALAKTFAQHSVAITMFSAFRLSWLRENHLRGEEFVGTRAFSDTATCVRWLEANPRIRRIPHPLFRYRQHPDQESNTAGDARAMMNAELDAWPRL